MTDTLLSGSVVESPKKEIKKTTPSPSANRILEYKLDLYNKRGEIRSSLSKELVRQASAQYGDIMRAIPSNKWVTLNEIVDSYWEIEKRFNFDMGRTRKKIEMAVNELVNNSIVVTK